MINLRPFSFSGEAENKGSPICWVTTPAAMAMLELQPRAQSSIQASRVSDRNSTTGALVFTDLETRTKNLTQALLQAFKLPFQEADFLPWHCL